MQRKTVTTKIAKEIINEIVTISEGYTRIGHDAFNYELKIQEVILPAGIEIIDDSAFAFCSNMCSCTIPQSLVKIGDCSFFDCARLASLTLPENIKHIDHDAFRGCDNLTVYCPANSYSYRYCIKNSINVIGIES